MCSLVHIFVLLSEASIYYNTANMIYAAIGAGGVFFILSSGALFLLFWPPTGYFIKLCIAWGLGLVSYCRLTMLLSRLIGCLTHYLLYWNQGITIGLKMVLQRFVGKNYWKSMYRRQPAAANLSSIAYECWSIG